MSPNRRYQGKDIRPNAKGKKISKQTQRAAEKGVREEKKRKNKSGRTRR